MTLKSRNESYNDAMGKANELAMAYCFAGNTWGAVEHYRSDGSGPLDVFNIAANTLGHDVTVQISDSAYQMVQFVVGFIGNTGIDVCSLEPRVAWTSNRDRPDSAGDHEKFTGVKDLNSEADIMLSYGGSTYGISAKYGVTKDPNLANPGLASIERMLGIDTLTPTNDAHRAVLVSLGYNGATFKEDHETWKKEKDSHRGLAAQASSLSSRHAIAGTVRSHLAQCSSTYVRDFVSNLCGRPTVFPHLRTQTRQTKSGTKYFVHDARELTEQKLRLYRDFKVDQSGKGTAVTIHATHVVLGEIEPVARLAFKSQSGPIKNVNGVFTAPMLTDRKRKRRALDAFDLDDTLFWYREEEAPLIHVHTVDGEPVASLTPSEFNNYKLPVDCRYDYREFESSQVFSEIAQPIAKVVAELQRSVAKGHDVEIVTARQDFDDKDLFLATLNRHGVDTSKVHVIRVGNRIGLGDPATAKKQVFRELVDSKGYGVIRFWEDNIANLRAFLSLADEYDDLRLEARLVKHNPTKGTTPISRITE